MADYVDKGLERMGITISKPMLAMICIIFGVVVILLPDLLVWIVGLFLMVQGILLLTDLLELGRTATAVDVKGVYCSRCGIRNIQGSIYCKKCGEKLEQLNQQKSQSKSKQN